MCRFRDTWLEKHPNWSYQLWNLSNLDFEPRCRPLLAQCQHPAQMADLLRIEILHRVGGVYIDTDFECLRPIDDLLEGVGDFASSEDGTCLTNSILGALPQSPLFNEIIESFPKRLGQQPVNIETGPVFFTRVVLTSGFRNDFTVFPTPVFFPFNYHTSDRHSADLCNSYAVHHYADSWKQPVPVWRKRLSQLKRAVLRVVNRPPA